MPDYYDVCELQVRSDDPPVPIVWETIPNFTYEDSERRRLRSKNYINQPRSETTFQMASGYTLPDGWRIETGGRLFFNPILGRTVPVKITAMRAGVPNVDSNEFTITRKYAFRESLIPNRIVLGLGFNQASQRVYVFNTTDIGISPRRDYVNSFNLDGEEQITESVEVTNVTPNRRYGGCFDGTNYWWCGGNNSLTESYLNKINSSGALVASYTVAGSPNIDIESLTFDGTYIWALDIRNYQIRKFNTSGVEQSGAITLPRATNLSDYTGYNFQLAQYGLTYADSHFWIPQHFIQNEEWIFCCSTSGVRVRNRDVETSFAVAGVTYNPTTDNLWWIYDREDDEGNRFGILNAQQI